MNLIPDDVIFDVILSYVDDRTYCNMRLSNKHYKKEIDKRLFPFPVDYHHRRIKQDRITYIYCNIGRPNMNYKRFKDDLLKMKNLKHIDIDNEMYKIDIEDILHDDTICKLESLSIDAVRLCYDDRFKSMKKLKLVCCDIEKLYPFPDDFLVQPYNDVNNDDIPLTSKEVSIITEYSPSPLKMNLSKYERLKKLHMNGSVYGDNDHIEEIKLNSDYKNVIIGKLSKIKNITIYNDRCIRSSLTFKHYIFDMLEVLSLTNIRCDVHLNHMLKRCRLKILHLENIKINLDLSHQSDIIDMKLFNISIKDICHMPSLKRLEVKNTVIDINPSFFPNLEYIYADDDAILKSEYQYDNITSAKIIENTLPIMPNLLYLSSGFDDTDDNFNRLKIKYPHLKTYNKIC